MNMPNVNQVKRYMFDCIERGEHRAYGEIDYTSLAEDAATAFNCNLDGQDIPEEFFEWSVEVAELFEDEN